MRLKPISLAAALALALTSGCSASRNAVSALRSRPAESADERIVTPPRHDREYDDPDSEHDEFRDPQPSSPREPVPAPPAHGVSRVKSVSFLRDLRGKINGRDSCGADCSDEQLVGQCSPVDPCVPGCATTERVERYRDKVYYRHDPDRINPAQSLRKRFSRVFHAPLPAASGACAEPLATPTELPQRLRPLPPARRLVCVPESCGDLTPAVTHQPDRGAVPRPGCLADPLDGPVDEVDPGLISPDSRMPHMSEELPEMPEIGIDQAPANGSPDNLRPIPAQPVPPEPEAGPSNPAAPIPAQPLPQGTTNQVVEPPSWPRLNDSGMARPVSQAVTLPNYSRPQNILITPRAKH